MVDVTITRAGTEFLVRAHTEDGEEFVDDMFGGMIFILNDSMQPIGHELLPRRNGAFVVNPTLIDDDLLDEAEDRGIMLRML
jgi:hypothetical protein